MDEYAKAYTEVFYMINNFEGNIKSKIPNEFMNFLKGKMDLKYTPIGTDNISEEAKAILSVVYSEYICSDAEKEKWNNLDEIYQKSISVEQTKNQLDFYRKSKENEERNKNTGITRIEEKSKLVTVLERIKTIFRSMWRK